MWLLHAPFSEEVKVEEVPPSVCEECKYLIVLLLQNNYEDRLEARDSFILAEGQSNYSQVVDTSGYLVAD